MCSNYTLIIFSFVLLLSNKFDQKQILEQTLNEWMGVTGQHEKQYEQIDDIIVMGIKV